MPVDNSVADCVHQFDVLYLCATPPHQLSSLYLYGDYDSCAAQRKNFALCLKAKAKSDVKEARKIVRGYEEVKGDRDMRKDENSPTKGVIWEFKEQHEKGWV
ncbi:hypothetical protein TrRE_jg2276 [Triparma retinervis]|uniref:Uncharacterized protein n=1 Tax=Triparma retinervis TaxID=2557542 RepID=A0A9W6ZKS0_9STRA|nr:hypothetical protein TrRE_jg2276 [Triparma retinervis]